MTPSRGARRKVAALGAFLLTLNVGAVFAQPKAPSGARFEQRLELPAAPSLDDRIRQMVQGDSLIGPVVSLDYLSTVRLSLLRNLTLIQRAYEEKIAQNGIDQAIAARNPTLTANGYFTHNDPNLAFGIRPNPRFITEAEADGFNAANVYITAQNQMLNRGILYVPIYTGGLLESAIHLQVALARSAKVVFKRITQNVAYLTKQQYLDALLARENLDVARQSVLEGQEILKVATTQLNSGVGTKLDVLLAEVALTQAQDAVVKTNASWERAKADLATLLDLPTLTELNLKNTLRRSDIPQLEPIPMRPLTSQARGGLPDADVKSLVQLALGQRPELEQLRQLLVANHARVVAASSGLLPKLTTNLEYDLIGFTERLRGGYMVLSSLRIPIYDGGLSRSRMLQLRLHKEQLKTDEIRQITLIALEVDKAQLALGEANSRLELAHIAEDRSREALRIARLRYQVGAGTSLELVTSQTTLANAQFGLAQARYRVLISLADLSLSLGQSVE
jgi:outer membrane protein TolC